MKIREKERELKNHMSCLALAVLLTSALTATLKIQPVNATGTIYIRADGSIDPSDAPISTFDNVTYTLTGNITSNAYGIVVGRDNIVVDGSGFGIEGPGGFSGYGIYLDGRSNVTIQNTKITDFHSGIRPEKSSNNDIRRNHITSNIYGIFLDYSSNNNISENTITNNNWDGIALISSSNNSIDGNTIADDGCGIRLWSSNNSSVSGNAFTNAGFVVAFSYANSVENNTVNGKPLVYLEGVADYSVGDAGQVVLVRCARISVENLNLSRTSYSVQLWETNNSLVSGNDITANYADGIGLSFSSNNSVVGNNITNNSNFGISLYSSSNYNNISRNHIANNYVGIWLNASSSNSIKGNTITNNSWHGIGLGYSSDNAFSHNNLINNTRQVTDWTPWASEYASFWDDGYPFAGNYWSDYNDADLFSSVYQNETGSDNIGDTPYVIGANNVDNYPLMRPYVPFDNQTIYVRADGSVDPSGAPILRKGDLYSLTDNIASDADGIVVERDNIVVDGSGFVVQGSLASLSNGIDLTGRSNVTVKNTRITEFHNGIYLPNSFSNSISGNNITNNGAGIWLGGPSSNNSINGNNIATNIGYWIWLEPRCIELEFSSNNIISGNNMTANHGYGIDLGSSSNNSISGNNIMNSDWGVVLDSSSSNRISGNNAMNNGCGIGLTSSSNNNTLSGNNVTATTMYGVSLYDSFNNMFYHNNFAANAIQVFILSSVNSWDDGYPSGGNYWDDYSGTDADHDGIGDTGYAIDTNNMDRYPLMTPHTRLVGDINRDNRVDMKDVGYVSRRFMCVPRDPLWDSAADFNTDGKINMMDIGTVARHFGEHYP